MSDTPNRPQDTPTIKGGESNPVVSPPPSSPTPPAGLSSPTSGGLDLATNPSVPRQDLSGDKLLLSAPKVSVGPEQTLVPALGGIPLLAKLGQGGMGAVYYGIHPRLEIEVAVKVLPFNIASQNPDMIKRFFREARIAARVRSPHLVTVTDVNEECGLYYLVMEFVKGESAGAVLKRARASGQPGLAEAIALEICIAATQGLAAAHAQGTIHRDIKPDNIMIPSSGAPGFSESSCNYAAAKLADLGLARGEGLDATLTGKDAAMGTPGFMAPEQIENARHCGKPADVFSMGATLYALLAGRSPFSGESFMKIARATIDLPHAPVRTIRGDASELTSRLINQCLAKKAVERFPDASALHTALKLCREKLGEPEKTIVMAAQELTQLLSVPEAGAPVSADTPTPSAAFKSDSSSGGAHPPTIAIARQLREEFKQARRALEKTGKADFTRAEKAIEALRLQDSNNGHVYYFEGEIKRISATDRFTAKCCIKPFSSGAAASLETYQDDFYQYLELARTQPASETNGEMGSEICYENPKGFCAQRTAWIHHLLANDFYEEGMATPDPHVRAAKLKRAAKHAKEARKYRRPEGGVGFDQGTDTVALQQKITEALSAIGLQQ